MTDHLDLEAIKEQVREGECPPGEFYDALISEVERLQTDAEHKNDVIARAMRLCEQERAPMTLGVLREASESPTEEGEG